MINVPFQIAIHHLFLASIGMVLQCFAFIFPHQRYPNGIASSQGDLVQSLRRRLESLEQRREERWAKRCPSPTRKIPKKIGWNHQKWRSLIWFHNISYVSSSIMISSEMVNTTYLFNQTPRNDMVSAACDQSSDLQAAEQRRAPSICQSTQAGGSNATAKSSTFGTPQKDPKRSRFQS